MISRSSYSLMIVVLASCIVVVSRDHDCSIDRVL